MKGSSQTVTYPPSEGMVYCTTVLVARLMLSGGDEYTDEGNRKFQECENKCEARARLSDYLFVCGLSGFCAASTGAERYLAVFFNLHKYLSMRDLHQRRIELSESQL